MKQKLLFLLIMIVLLAVTVMAPWLLAAIFDSNIWYWSFVPLLVVSMVVWVKGFDYIEI